MSEGIRRPRPNKPVRRVSGDILPDALCGDCGDRRDQHAEFLPAPCLRGHPAPGTGPLTAARLEAIDTHTGCRCLGFMSRITLRASMLRTFLLAAEGRATAATLIRDSDAEMAKAGGPPGYGAPGLPGELAHLTARGLVEGIEWHELPEGWALRALGPLEPSAPANLADASYTRCQGWRLTPAGRRVAAERWGWALAADALRAVNEERLAGWMAEKMEALIPHAIRMIEVERQRPGSEALPWEEARARLLILAEMHPPPPL